jgi:hypothetical protein
MPKVYVLDTSTKGTGANVRPLDEPDGEQPRRRDETPAFLDPRRARGKRKAPAPPPPRRPRRFKLVDVMTGETLAEDVDTRAVLEALQGLRSVNDVRVFARREDTEDWRLLSLREQRALWDARGRAVTARRADP